MGFFSNLRSTPNSRQNDRSKSRKRSVSNSTNHEEAQVIGFKRSIKGDGLEPDMNRDLYSVPKPSHVEGMSDYLSNHKEGDVFPYVAVMGNEEENKESRLSRLRAFKSPYGKVNKPEMRINGVVLDETEGTIQVQHLKDYVDKSRLSSLEARQNKRFKPVAETSFSKPYIHISRITGEFVPLISSTADYTDLHFTLEDGRLLEHQVIAQSIKMPSNLNGVFELSCDYCISVKDLAQLSLKYFLARPIMKDNFQWGAVSLVVRISESDTPYLTPKVEAMGIVRTPFTTLEENTKDMDHADVVYTAAQVSALRELFRAGDIADIDEPKKVRAKTSSYSKSTIRGTQKGIRGPEHLGNQTGWEQLKGMRKPLIEEGVASISALSDDEEEDITPDPMTKERYEKHQEELRAEHLSQPANRSPSPIMSDENYEVESPEPQPRENVFPKQKVIKSAMKKTRFGSPSEDESQPPNTSAVFSFE